MANTPKLASTFSAWRIVFTVAEKYFAAAWLHCFELGLQPSIRKYGPSGVDELGGLFSIAITVPCCACKSPEEFMDKEIKPQFKGYLSDQSQVCLICPLPPALPEGKRMGMCPHCTGTFFVDGPRDSLPKFILPEHKSGGGYICVGSGTEPTSLSAETFRVVA